MGVAGEMAVAGGEAGATAGKLARWREGAGEERTGRGARSAQDAPEGVEGQGCGRWTRTRHARSWGRWRAGW